MIYNGCSTISLTQFRQIQDSIPNLSCDAMRILCDFELNDEKQMRNIAVEGEWWSERSSIVFESTNFTNCHGRAAANQSKNWPRFPLDLAQQKLDITCRLRIHEKNAQRIQEFWWKWEKVWWKLESKMRVWENLILDFLLDDELWLWSCDCSSFLLWINYIYAAPNLTLITIKLKRWISEEMSLCAFLLFKLFSF